MGNISTVETPKAQVGHGNGIPSRGSDRISIDPFTQMLPKTQFLNRIQSPPKNYHH